jgi:hypothetical protein
MLKTVDQADGGGCAGRDNLLSLDESATDRRSPRRAKRLALLDDFFAFDPAFQGGIFVGG